MAIWRSESVRTWMGRGSNIFAVVIYGLSLVEQLDDPLLADGVPVVVEADLDGLLAALQPEALRPRNRVLRPASCSGIQVCMHLL